MFLPVSAAVAVLFATTPTIVTNPEWREIPSADRFAEVYPKRALREEVEGKATVRCKVGADERLRDCTVESETPAGYGFGDAALAMTADFRIRPMTRDGKPVDGAEIRVPISFKLPEDDFAIPDMDEALRCFVAIGDLRLKQPNDYGLFNRQAYLWVVIQAHALDQQLDAAGIEARLKTTREAMARGEISADWCG